MKFDDIPKIGFRRAPLSGIRPNDESYVWRGLGNLETVAFKRESYSLTDLILAGTVPGQDTKHHANLDVERQVSYNITENLRRANCRNSEPAGVWVPFEILCRDAVSDTASYLVETHVQKSLATHSSLTPQP